MRITPVVGDNNPNYKHGFSTATFKHPLYVTYYNMRSRCYNPKNAKFHRYGGRGIAICDDWLDKKNFFDWSMVAGWQKGLTIDRINNDGNYEPNNCRWIIMGRNARKKSTTKLTIASAKEIRSKFNGSNTSELAIEYNVCQGSIWFIVNNLTWNETL